MQSRWNDDDAREAIERYGPQSGEDLALRVYTSRLIGADRNLVLHGGGNTSVKTTVTGISGRAVDVICVKGSGWGLASIEPAGLPAVEMASLHELRGLDELSDEQMVNEVRRRLLDASAPTPSVETLLHAYLPHKFIDHTHADAILEITDQPDAESKLREALGDKVVVLPWIMPGFPLAVAVAEAYEAAPDCEGIVLCKHGLFTFGDDARSSYERMIDLVDRAERWVNGRLGGTPELLAINGATDDAAATLSAVAPTVRGALAWRVDTPLGSVWHRMVAEWRGDEDLIALSRQPNCAELIGRGPLTPDHVIRTKGRYLYLTRAQAEDGEACRAAVRDYVAAYGDYYGEHRHTVSGEPSMLDPYPRVVVIEGCGLLTFGADKKAAVVAADIAQQTLRSLARAEGVERYDPLPPAQLFEVEYWSLQLAKLGKKKPPLLQGQVALVTGAAGAIGCGVAESLMRAGAHVVLSDLRKERLQSVSARMAQSFAAHQWRSVAADITGEADVAEVFAFCAREFGGVDIVVANAGIAHVAQLADLEAEQLQRVMDVNVQGVANTLKCASRIMQKQGTGGAIVVQSSKNVFDPGAGFGAYSASKAAAHQLGKIAALELASHGVRVNMINADAVFGDDDVPSGLWQEVGPDRMRERGMDLGQLRDYYRERSLLKTAVLPAHVGEAVVFLASGVTPTTGATLPVDAGIPGAFPR